MRITRDGNVMAEEVLERNVSYPPLATWNGKAFDIAWLYEEPAGDGDIVFRRGDGEPVIIDSLESEKSLAIASIPNVSTLLAYARTINDAAHGSTTRVFARAAPVAINPKSRAVRR